MSSPVESSGPTDAPVPVPTTDAPPAPHKDPAMGFTRAGALWTSLIFGFLILIVLLILFLFGGLR